MSLSKRALASEVEERELEPEAIAVNSMSLEDAIQEFVRIQRRYAELAEEKKRALAILVPAAYETRGAANTCRLDSADGKTQLKIEFKSAFKCEVDRLNTARELLGDDRFEDLFKTEYKPKLRTFRAFLTSKSTDERVETARAIIKESVTESDLSPQITIEKSPPEILDIPW